MSRLDRDDLTSVDDVGEVVVVCRDGADRGCGTDFRAYVVGDNAPARYAAAQSYLAGRGWTTGPDGNVCPRCGG